VRVSPVLVILVLIWVAALTPVLLRKLADRESISSVDRFQRGLGVMRSAHPRLAAAAHRSIVIEGIDGLARPARFTGAASEWTTAHDIPAVQAVSADERSPGPYRTTLASSVKGSRPAARRRRHVLAGLASLVVLTFVIGLASGLRSWWDVSLICLALLAAYTALLVHFHRIAVERAQKVVLLRAAAGRNVSGEDGEWTDLDDSVEMA
jgi:hypothetical protein